MPLHVSSTFAHHQQVKIALHSLWYHHTYRRDDTRGWEFYNVSSFNVNNGIQLDNNFDCNLTTFISVISQLDAQNFCFTISLYHASTCFVHMCSKHVEAWNKLIVKQKFCASSWLISEINIPRCTVSKTSKNRMRLFKNCEFRKISWP